jgi:predicted MFS family arabinose efflux permease
LVPRRTVFCLGLSQLVCWGISYYLIGAFGDLIAGDLGWSPSVVHGGFSAALAVMGLSSPFVGRTIDRHGGRAVMVAGSAVTAAGCIALALADGIALYYAAWLCLGLAMRMTLYDAAFAALARIGGAAAKRPISQVTLLGGLASTVFWPIGHALAGPFGWRGAVFAYAGFALLTIPLHLALPPGRAARPTDAPADRPAAASKAGGGPRLAAALYAVIAALTSFLNSGLSAHMIAMLAGLGMAAGLAVWVAALRGIGQSAARLCEVASGSRLHPLTLAVLATALLPVAFLAGLFSGQLVVAGIAFAFLYGAGNGLVTIVRGTLPLVLFEPGAYGSLVGRLLAPSFILAALAPLAYAVVIENFGDGAAFALSAAVAAVVLAAAVTLRLRFR